MKRKANLNLELRLQVKRKDGTIRSDTGWMDSHSFVSNWLGMLVALVFAQMDAIGSTAINVKEISGTIRAFNPSNNDAEEVMKLLAPQNNDVYGILVGTDNTTPTNDDYKLNAKVDHGIGSGELNYGACSRIDPYPDSGTIKALITRSFVNSSGGTITVREVGQVLYSEDYGGSSVLYAFLISHDVFADIAVDDGETLNAQFAWVTAVDESDL
jgi:hypothetical protein